MDIHHEMILGYLDKVRASTLKFLEDLPEEILEKAPAAGQPVAETLRHICFSVDYWCHQVFKDGLGEKEYSGENCGGREALRKALEDSARRLGNVFAADDGAALGKDFHAPWGKTYHGADRLLYLVAHEVHHRGRAVQVARELGWEGKARFPM